MLMRTLLLGAALLGLVAQFQSRTAVSQAPISLS